VNEAIREDMSVYEYLRQFAFEAHSSGDYTMRRVAWFDGWLLKMFALNWD